MNEADLNSSAPQEIKLKNASSLLPLELNFKLSDERNPKPQWGFELTTPIKQKNIKFADPRATRALVAIMDMFATLKGAASHFGGPAAFAEIMSALHGFMFAEADEKGQPWHQLFHFVNDAGHCENGLYAIKANYQFGGLSIDDLMDFRGIHSKLTGHGESHLYPEGVLISNGPLGSALPQAQGLAMADALLKKSRVTICALSDGAAMEGEAKEALAAIPGFSKKGLLAPFILVVSDNNTKLSGRIDEESFDMMPSFSSLKELGWRYEYIPQGNDLKSVVAVVEKALIWAHENPKQPVVLHLKTIKGIGTEKTAKSASGGHGFPLKSAKELLPFLEEIYQGEGLPSEIQYLAQKALLLEQELAENPGTPKHQGLGAFNSYTWDEKKNVKIQNGISKAMIDAVKKGYPVVSITSDLPGSTGVAGFRKEFPELSLDVGVAEANMISVAAGFSLSGLIPVVDTFAQFGVTKGALPLTMASLSGGNMIAVFSHTGFQDAADGASHQALTYLGMCASIPNVRAYALTCSEEAESLMSEAISEFKKERLNGKVPFTRVFFLGRENFPASFGQKKYSLTEAQCVFETELPEGQVKKRVTLVAPGSLLIEAIKAAQILATHAIEAQVINPGCLNHIDIKSFSDFANWSKGNIITLEDHQIIGGFGALLSHALITKAEFSFPLKIKSIGVNGEFGQSAYEAQHLYEKHQLTAEHLVKITLAL